MGSNFSKIKIGDYFTTSDEETFKKTSALTFDDMAKIEHYIDPFMDKKIGAAGSVKADVDTSARIVAGTPLAELTGDIHVNDSPKPRARKKRAAKTK
jgi:hypothetical protein